VNNLDETHNYIHFFYINAFEDIEPHVNELRKYMQYYIKHFKRKVQFSVKEFGEVTAVKCLRYFIYINVFPLFYVRKRN
jgi:hypothetical protein